MANPGNKKSGESYLQSFTKEKLIAKYIDLASHNTELEREKASLEEEVIALNKKIDILSKKVNKFNTKDEIVKKILEYKARNLVPTIIREKLLLDGIDTDLKIIKEIYNGELSLEHEAYYKKCVEDYIETIRIDTKYYKQSSIEELNRILGYAYENLELCDKEDIKLRMSIIDSISTYIEKRDKLMKNIDETSTFSEEEEYMNQSFDNFKETSDKIIQLNNVKIKAIGGE